MIQEMPVDFVIPWVDGQDIAWQEKKNCYRQTEGDNIHPARYRDWGLLRYLFRGIERFTPWVNRIWIVSDDQVPEWLNIDHPKVRLISQDTLLPSQCRPTFNINAIELNMHRIPGLSDRFVYLNDDMFFLKDIPQSSFFRDGLPCDVAILSPVIVTRKLDVGSIVVNDMCLINSHFVKGEVMKQRPLQWVNIRYGAQLLRTICLMPWRHFPGFYNPHLPQPYLKSSFEAVWEAEPERLSEVCTHRFRNFHSDVNHWLVRYWQLCSGNFCPMSPRYGRDLPIMCIEETENAICGKRYSYVCINDDERIDEIAPYQERLKNALDNILHEKSAFEI